MQASKHRELDRRNPWQMLLEEAERLKACVRAKVRYPLHAVKSLFLHQKVRYKVLAKN
jgi:hypothetical protein